MIINDMGIKLLWTSVTIYLAATVFTFPAATEVAAVLAIIGCILNWLDR